MNLGKIKASQKQLDREDRLNWGGRRRSNPQQKRGRTTHITVKAEEVDDETNK